MNDGPPTPLDLPALRGHAATLAAQPLSVRVGERHVLRAAALADPAIVAALVAVVGSLPALLALTDAAPALPADTIQPATPLPWSVDGSVIVMPSTSFNVETNVPADAAYIVAACNERPALLDALAAARAEVERLREERDRANVASETMAREADRLHGRVLELEGRVAALRAAGGAL